MYNKTIHLYDYTGELVIIDVLSLLKNTILSEYTCTNDTEQIICTYLDNLVYRQIKNIHTVI